MLQLAIGYGKNLIEAKERAAYFYEQVQANKRFLFVETQPGFNEVNESVFVTTIWYETFTPVPREEESKFEYIGSTGVDPNDPDWLLKWQDQQKEHEGELANIADH